MSTVDQAPADARAVRDWVTPEGVDLKLELASVGQRFGALMLDLLIIVGAVIALIIGIGLMARAVGRNGGELIMIVLWLGMFGLRNGYFLFFEASARSATPGKRAMKIRVAARDGGRLRFEAVFTRNVLRELELFLPLTVLLAAPFTAQVDSWMTLLGVIWCAVFVLLPFFNRDRLRAGDLVAGTWVVRAPRQKLLRDMADEGAAHRARFAFTAAQLDVYGVKELQVLEQVLRIRDRKTMREVADRIAAKIGWVRGTEDDLDFLRAYYHGVRERLEARLLMGRRRRDKHDV